MNDDLYFNYGCSACDGYRPENSQSPVGMGVLQEISVTYPAVTGLPNPAVQRRINQQIAAQARKTLPDSFNGNIIEAQSGYTATVQKNNILSLRFQNYYFPEFAAHGMTYVKSITVNTRTGQVYQLRDLFNPATSWRQTLNLIIRQQIAAQQIPMLKEFEGIRGDEEFYLTPNELVIYYQIYEYTPYVYGILEFRIPYAQIFPIINPSGPIPYILLPSPQ